MTQATLHTTEAARISKRLVNHWRHKFTISEHENTYTIHMPSADIVLVANQDNLQVQLIGTTADFNSEKLQEVAANHLDRMANETFEYQWMD